MPTTPRIYYYRNKLLERKDLENQAAQAAPLESEEKKDQAHISPVQNQETHSVAKEEQNSASYKSAEDNEEKDENIFDSPQLMFENSVADQDDMDDIIKWNQDL